MAIRKSRQSPQILEDWLGGLDSNQDNQIQSLMSYHWTTSQQLAPKRTTDYQHRTRSAKTSGASCSGGL